MSGEPEVESGAGEETPLVESPTAEEPDPVEKLGEDLRVIGPDSFAQVLATLEDCAARIDSLLSGGGFEVEALRKVKIDLENAAAGWRADVEIRMTVRRNSGD